MRKSAICGWPMHDASSKSMWTRLAFYTIFFSTMDSSINRFPIKKHQNVLIFSILPADCCHMCRICLCVRFVSSRHLILPDFFCCTLAQNSKMRKPCWSAKCICCWTIERSKTNRPTRSRSFQRFSWRHTPTPIYSANSKIRKLFRPCAGKSRAVCNLAWSTHTNWGRLSCLSFDFLYVVCWVRRNSTNSNWLHWVTCARTVPRKPKHWFHHSKDVSKMKSWDKFWTILAPNEVYNINSPKTTNHSLKQKFCIENGVLYINKITK